MKPYRLRFRSIVGLNMLIVMSLCIIPLHAQQREKVLEEVLEHYSQQEYETIIQLLTDTPPGTFAGKTEKVFAYEMLASSYLKLAQPDSARTVLGRLITLEPNYDPASPPRSEAYLNMVARVKAMQESGGKSRKWYWIGGGAASAVAVTLYFVLRGGQEETLPEAPDPPNIQ